MPYYLLTYNYVKKFGSTGTGFKHIASPKKLTISNIVAKLFIEYKDHLFSNLQLFELTAQEYKDLLDTRNNKDAGNN